MRKEPRHLQLLGDRPRTVDPQAVAAAYIASAFPGRTLGLPRAGEPDLDDGFAARAAARFDTLTTAPRDPAVRRLYLELPAHHRRRLLRHRTGPHHRRLPHDESPPAMTTALTPARTGLITCARADDLPSAAWRTHDGRPHPDPRRTRAWALAHRWPGDGTGYVVTSPAGPPPVAAATRRIEDHRGWARMNAVDICGGLTRDVVQDERLVAAARRQAVRQWSLALAGYATPVWSADPSPARLAGFLDQVADASRTAGTFTAVLHIEQYDPLLPVLRGLGWRTGVTDLSAVLTGFGRREADFVAGLPAGRRTSVRRELRRVREQGGGTEIIEGAAIAPHQARVAELEAATDVRHGGPRLPGRLREMNERLLACFGADMALAAVRDATGDLVTTCTLLRGRYTVLPRFTGFDAARARPLAGYFQACYHLPMAYARASGAGEVLLGTGSLRPKLNRGARLRPLYSAVPADATALAELLERTDGAMRERAAAGHPVRGSSGDRYDRTRAGAGLRTAP